MSDDRTYVVLHTGAVPAAFNHFINNINGFFEFEPATDTFGVLESFMNQAQLDGRATAYQAAQAAADAAYQQFLDGEKTTGQQNRYGNDDVSRALVEVMRVELNEIRARFSAPPLPDITEGQMDAKIRAEIANP